MSRRLSVGNNLLTTFSNPDESFIIDKEETNNLKNRRRSSFGFQFKPTRSIEEENRIADMYQTVIKLSSENKINDKNSWTFDLIDQMGRILTEESISSGVNFQKASCTLDASIKIYSHRVDDTYASSHRILESLSRNNAVADENGEMADKKLGKFKGARVGQKTTSDRLHLTRTLETDPSKLNVAKEIETEQGLDPSFHKMSRVFDEGGARGMLVSNLRVTKGSSCIAFNTEALSPRPEPLPSQPLDLSEIVLRSGLNLRSLAPLSLCPGLDLYRSQLGLPCGDMKAEGREDFSLACYNPDPLPYSLASRKLREREAPSLPPPSPLPTPSPPKTFVPFCSDGPRSPEPTPMITDTPPSPCPYPGPPLLDLSAISSSASFCLSDPDTLTFEFEFEKETETPLPSSQPPLQFLDFDDDDDNDNEEEEGTGGEGGGDGALVIANRILEQQRAKEEGISSHKILWGSVFAGPGPDQQPSPSIPPVGSALSQDSESKGGDPCLPPSSLPSDLPSSWWAGARHWKLAGKMGRGQQKPSPLGEAEEERLLLEVAQEEGEEVGEGEEGRKERVKGGRRKVRAKAKKVQARVRVDFTRLLGPHEPLSLSKEGERLFEIPFKSPRSSKSCQPSMPELLRPGPLPEQLLTSSQAFSAALRALPAFKPSSDPRSLTDSSVVRLEAASGESRLPADARVAPLDLCRLFLVPRVTLATLPLPASRPESSALTHAHRVVWFVDGVRKDEEREREEGTHRKSTDWMGEGMRVRKEEGWDLDDGDGDNDYGGGEAGSAGEGSIGLEEELKTLSLELKTDGLVTAHRKVEKIDIGYATTSKRVDVKKLKSDIWGCLQSQNQNLEDPLISFKNIVGTVEADQVGTQKEASLSYYFICLLHLANEKTLQIKGNSDMSDLLITK